MDVDYIPHVRGVWFKIASAMAEWAFLKTWIYLHCSFDNNSCGKFITDKVAKVSVLSYHNNVLVPFLFGRHVRV